MLNLKLFYFICLLFLLACAPEKAPGFAIMPKYTVDLDYTFTSSGGDREYHLRYGVKKEEYTFCEGRYEFHGPYPGYITECTLEALNTDERFDRAKKMSDIIKELNEDYGVTFENLKLDAQRCWSDIILENDLKLCLDEENYIISFKRENPVHNVNYSWRIER